MTQTVLQWFQIIVLVWGGALSCAAAPGILITHLPGFGSSDNLGGRVLNVNPAEVAVAVFIYVPGYGWVTKPTCAQPLTAVQADGSWSADITTGGSDSSATRVAALLVGTNFSEPCVAGAAFLPTNLFAQARAKTVVTRTHPGARSIRFSDYDWWVKTGAGLLGPGPNYFSDSTNNVWVDGQGWLHLRITHRSNQWQCAEIVSARTFGPGHYRFELNSPVGQLNPNVTLGLFTWSDDPAYAYREIDVEGARWGNAADPTSAQFVVQPYDLNGHLYRYAVPTALSNSTHLFVWRTNQIGFQAQAGAYSPGGTNVLAEWLFDSAPAVPQSGDENVRLNLWLVFGNPPTDNHEVEFVIKRFHFVPLEAPGPSQLGKLELLAGDAVQFQISAQPDFRYQVETSSDLVQWNHLTTALATNNVIQVQATNSGAGARFYRAITLP